MAVAAVGYALFFAPGIFGQTTLTWQQLKEKFEASNPTLQAAHARRRRRPGRGSHRLSPPQPGVRPRGGRHATPPYRGVYRPFAGTQISPSVSYLHERDNKRELRRDAAKLNTAIAGTSVIDQERSLLFNLRNAYVQVLKAKALIDNAKENLDYWDHELDISRTRYQAGDLALVDLNRLELQRTQFEADYESAIVGLRTAKIQLLMLMNDRTPLDQFDVTGAFDFSEDLRPLEEYRKLAVDARPRFESGDAGRGARRRRRISSPSPTDRPIRRSADGGRIILRSIIHTITTPSAPASAFLCAFSTTIRARRRARRTISAEKNVWWTVPRRKCSATWIPLTGRWFSR